MFIVSLIAGLVGFPEKNETRFSCGGHDVTTLPHSKTFALERIQSWFGVIKATKQRPTEREQLCCECVTRGKTPDQFSNWSKKGESPFPVIRLGILE